MIRLTSYTTIGHRFLRTDPQLVQALNNVEITHADWLELTDHLGLYGLVMRFTSRGSAMKRSTSAAWGLAWDEKGLAVLYRPSVAVMLHELAHLLTWAKPSSAHGKAFAENMDYLIDRWMALQAAYK